MNDADRLSLDPVMRWIVGGHAVTKQAASSSQMGRFETEVLATEENLAALGDLSGRWIDRVHDRCPQKKIILDMDSSVSPTHGAQEGSIICLDLCTSAPTQSEPSQWKPDSEYKTTGCSSAR